MSYLVVCPLSLLQQTASKHQPRDMITLINQGTEVIRPDGIAENRHLFLGLNDINNPVRGLTAPEESHVMAIVDYAQKWDQTAPLLIHCWLGISRSTAAAYIIAAALNPNRNEEELAQSLRHNAPSATPNARLIALADKILARNGRMVAAIQQIGRGAEASQGTPFTLQL